jgi:thiamine kinase-like enzyme
MQREELTIENIKMAQIMKKFHNLGICHNDLNLTNIIVESSGKLCIIHWEYCRENGDILYDIANFFTEWMYDYTCK